MLWPASPVRGIASLQGYLSSITVLVKVTITIAMVEQHDQSNMRKRLMWLTLLHHNSFSEEVRTGIQVGQEHEGATDAEAMLALMACSAWVFIELNTTSPRMSLLSMGWTVSP